MMAEEFEVRPVRAEDAPALNALYRRLTGIDRSLAQWRWEWLDGPDGPAPAFAIVSRADGAVVGHHGVVPVRLTHGGRTFLAARTENTMVDPEMRTRLRYPAIEARLLAELLPRFAAIFTTSGKGVHGLVRKRLGYRSVGRWRAFTVGATPSWIAARLGGAAVAGLAGLAGYSIQAPRGWSLEAFERAEHADASTWADPSAIAPLRDHVSLRWRLLEHPYHPIRTMRILRGAEPRGLIAWREAGGTSNARDVTVDDLAGADAEACRAGLRLLLYRHRRAPVRLLLRTLDNGRPLAELARTLAPRWARRGADDDGAELLVRSDVFPADAPWDATWFLAEGI